MSSPAPKYWDWLGLICVPVASSNLMSGYFAYSWPLAPFEKFPNEHPKIIVYPSRARPATICGTDAFENTFSLYVVETLFPNVFTTSNRPSSCACDHPWSLCGPG